MSDAPVPQYTIAQAITACLVICQRCLTEVRALARIPGPMGQPGERGEKGEAGIGERGEKGEAGPAGRDAKTWRHRRTYDAKQDYGAGDVVAHDGGSWIALGDEPGALPGDGWAQLTVRGQRGKPGEKGERGPPGREGRGISDLSITENGETLIVEFTDGTHRSIDLVTR